MRSLQARLGVSLAISLVALFILEWFVVSPTIRKLTDDYVISRLRLDATSLLALVTISEDGTPEVDASRLDPLYQRPLSGHYFQVITADGHPLQSQSLWDEAFHVPMTLPGEVKRAEATGPSGQQLLVLVSGFEKQGHHLTLAIAEDITPLKLDLRQFQNAYMVASLIILGSLIAIQSLIVQLSFRPLHRVRQDIARLERGEMSQIRESVPTEVRPVVQEMNRLLRVLEERLRRSRNALGNLAHALKTPLTLVMQLAEYEDMDKAPEARSQLREYTTILHHRLERELRRARLAGGDSANQRLVLDDEITPLIDTVRSLYQDMDLDIVCCMPKQTVFRGNREDFLELLGNLLNNACQWARHQIAITIDDASRLYLTVEDDGPGCPADVLQHLAKRGVRLDESIPGHGLGLAICKDIVQQYNGDIVFGRSSQLGGFLVEVTLPNGPSRE
ncbi:MAG: ATP-binding protein [Candidatus Tectomicrobia bacterium]|nr:ATP-binding protein [Candidatus Tectomicrobia bacterium]